VEGVDSKTRLSPLLLSSSSPQFSVFDEWTSLLKLPPHKHYTVFSRSLQAMFKTLRRDIFQLRLPGFPIEKVKPPSPNPLAAAEYACVYWVDHLHHSRCHKRDDISVDEIGCVGDFLQKKYLYWLEALSVLGSLSQGIAAMLKLEGLFQVSNCLYTETISTSDIRTTIIGRKRNTCPFTSNSRRLPIYSIPQSSN
jgi:hypothetical protein